MTPTAAPRAKSDALQRAARALSDCDTLVVCLGAGMGKDSGLATYQDFGDRPVIVGGGGAGISGINDATSRHIRRRPVVDGPTSDVSGGGVSVQDPAPAALSYAEVCSPQAACDHYDLFAEFWADRCGRVFAETAAHEGYSVLERWVGGGNASLEEGGSRSPLARTTSTARREESSQSGGPGQHTKLPNLRTHYCYTSNVDGHLRRFPRLGSHVCEIHGSCADPWVGFWRFEKVVPENGAGDGGAAPEIGDSGEDEDVFNSVRSSWRRNNCGPPKGWTGDPVVPPGVPPVPSLVTSPYDSRHQMPWPVAEVRHPITPRGYGRKRYERPRVLLFGDNCDELFEWLNARERAGYDKWKREVVFAEDETGPRPRTANEDHDSGMDFSPARRLVVLEIGCGLRVPSCRREAERLVWDFNADIPKLRGADCRATLIRINPGDTEDGWRKLDSTDFENPLFWFYDTEKDEYRTVGHQVGAGAYGVQGDFILLNHDGAMATLKELEALIGREGDVIR